MRPRSQGVSNPGAAADTRRMVARSQSNMNYSRQEQPYRQFHEHRVAPSAMGHTMIYANPSEEARHVPSVAAHTKSGPMSGVHPMAGNPAMTFQHPHSVLHRGGPTMQHRLPPDPIPPGLMEGVHRVVSHVGISKYPPRSQPELSRGVPSAAGPTSQAVVSGVQYMSHSGGVMAEQLPQHPPDMDRQHAAGETAWRQGKMPGRGWSGRAGGGGIGGREGHRNRPEMASLYQGAHEREVAPSGVNMMTGVHGLHGGLSLGGQSISTKVALKAGSVDAGSGQSMMSLGGAPGVHGSFQGMAGTACHTLPRLSPTRRAL
jgi:hypothetical protein